MLSFMKLRFDLKVIEHYVELQNEIFTFEFAF